MRPAPTCCAGWAAVRSRAAYDKAIELAGNTAETAYLTRRRDQLGVVPGADLATGQVGVAGGAVVEGLVGSDGVVDPAEPVDFDVRASPSLMGPR